MLKKSLTELRGIAQSYDIKDIFSKTPIQLTQEIELKQREFLPKEIIEIPRPEYDARLMDKPPSRKSDREGIEDLLKIHVERGLHLSFDEESWHMKFGKKEDHGTLRMPLRNILECANKVLK